MTNFVLLHGAFHGGWCWPRVAGPLRAAGHAVITPTQTGLGERAHLLSRDITLDVFVQDLTHLLGNGLPCTYVACMDPEYVTLAGHRPSPARSRAGVIVKSRPDITR